MEDDEKDETVTPHETVDTPTAEPPERSTPPATQTHGSDSLNDRLNSLSETVASLAETVSNIVSKADPDTTPVKKPWTHWGAK